MTDYKIICNVATGKYVAIAFSVGSFSHLEVNGAC